MSAECARCEGPIVGDPVRDLEQVACLPAGQAQVFCSDGCLEAAAERWHDVVVGGTN